MRYKIERKIGEPASILIVTWLNPTSRTLFEHSGVTKFCRKYNFKSRNPKAIARRYKIERKIGEPASILIITWLNPTSRTLFKHSGVTKFCRKYNFSRKPISPIKSDGNRKTRLERWFLTQHTENSFRYYQYYIESTSIKYTHFLKRNQKRNSNSNRRNHFRKSLWITHNLARCSIIIKPFLRYSEKLPIVVDFSQHFLYVYLNLRNGTFGEIIPFILRKSGMW